MAPNSTPGMDWARASTHVTGKQTIELDRLVAVTTSHPCDPIAKEIAVAFELASALEAGTAQALSHLLPVYVSAVKGTSGPKRKYTVVGGYLTYYLALAASSGAPRSAVNPSTLQCVVLKNPEQHTVKHEIEGLAAFLSLLAIKAKDRAATLISICRLLDNQALKRILGSKLYRIPDIAKACDALGTSVRKIPARPKSSIIAKYGPVQTVPSPTRRTK